MIKITGADVFGKKTDVLVDGDRIKDIGDLGGKYADAEVVDADGLALLPAFVDMHVHLREPGQEYKEDIESGSRAAVAGGFSAVCCMPNTKPVMDSPDRIDYVTVKARSCAPLHVLQAGAATQGQNGPELAALEGIAAPGHPALREGGKSVMNSTLCGGAWLDAR